MMTAHHARNVVSVIERHRRRRRRPRASAAPIATRPSRSCSAAATAGAVGTSPISPTPLMPNGDRGCGTSTRLHLDRRHVLRAQDAERAQRHVGGEAGRGIARELLGERVAEAHVHAALDLALAQQRVDRLADVVDGDHAHDVAGVAVDLDHLRRVPEGRVDGGVGIVRDRPAAASSRPGARPRSRPRRHSPRPGRRGMPAAPHPAAISVPRDPVVCPKPSWRVVSTMTSMRSGSMPSSLRGHLQRDGVHALTHLGPSVAHLDAPVGAEAHDRARDLAEAVAQPAVLQPQADADGTALRRGLRRTAVASRRGTPRRRRSRRP